MPYKYNLDDGIKSLTLILFNFFFLVWVNLHMIMDTYLHDPPPFNSPFFMTPPFSAVSKSCDPPSVSIPLPPANFWQIPNMYLIVQLCPFNFAPLKKQSIPVSKSHNGTCPLVALAVSK